MTQQGAFGPKGRGKDYPDDPPSAVAARLPPAAIGCTAGRQRRGKGPEVHPAPARPRLTPSVGAAFSATPIMLHCTAVRWTCAYRKSSPSILVMQSTQDRAGQNASRCLDGA